MRKRIIVIPIVVFFLSVKSFGQYKDLDGVVFGKVIAVGVGASAQLYGDKSFGSGTSITPITYSVIFNRKFLMSFKFAFHKKIEATYSGIDEYSLASYTQTASFNFKEFEIAWKISLTPEGLDKPTSVFFNFQPGILFGKMKTSDTGYDEFEEDTRTFQYFGAGLTGYQKLGSKFMLFVEPAYRFVITPASDRIYFGHSNENQVKFSHFNGQAGILFLIGKKG